MTGDGLVDAVLGIADGRMRVATGSGDGLFAAGSLNAVAGGSGGGAIALTDANGDGLPDVLCSNSVGAEAQGQAFVRTLLNEGGSAFIAQTLDGLASTTPLGSPLLPIAGHLNGDGAVDLAVIHGTSGTVSIVLNELATFQLFGVAKPGSGGFEPTLFGSGYTTPGGTFQILAEGGLGGAPALLQMGLGRTREGALLVAEPVASFFLTLGGSPGVPGDGTLDCGITVPGDPAWIGVEVVQQLIVADPGATTSVPFGFALSNGLAYTIAQ